MKQQVKGKDWIQESAALMSSHLRISMNYHELLRERATPRGTYRHWHGINPQRRGIIHCHNTYCFRQNGDVECRSVMWRVTRKGKLMGDVDIQWYVCKGYNQIVDMSNAFHRKPKWNMN